jgi:hypothetical protein
MNRRGVSSKSTDVSEKMSSPASGFKNKYIFPPAWALVSCSAYSSYLKMEAAISSETSFDFTICGLRLKSYMRK